MGPGHAIERNNGEFSVLCKVLFYDKFVDTLWLSLAKYDRYDRKEKGMDYFLH
ncbi:hypothetical protein FM107_05885 [Sphingobacterium sp. JB170]|nr:hypothetical protein FM107_05885 [Sphingobacterium sp. JB170]